MLSKDILLVLRYITAGFLLLCFFYQDQLFASNKTRYRIALFNIRELSTEKLTELAPDGRGKNEQVIAAARIIGKIKPDILIINEIDHDYSDIQKGLGMNLDRFQEAYLRRGREGFRYKYQFVAPCNTGLLTGFDLNNDGIVATTADIGSNIYGNDCYGYGRYPGQYAMAVFSMFPFDHSKIRTFQTFLWQDLPGNHIPPQYYSDQELAIFRLSSKSHWDLPVLLDGRVLHLFLSHPTPPGFDGIEDRNGRRNFDEIKFWTAYLADHPDLYDDQNVKGGYSEKAPFIIAGDLNASPANDQHYDNKTAIAQLLKHPQILDTGRWLTSLGAIESQTAGARHYPERATAKFGQDRQMRIDYILPDKRIKVLDGGVYWPASSEDEQGQRLAEHASDHRLIWLDITLP